MLKNPEYKWGDVIVEKPLWCDQLQLTGTPDLIARDGKGGFIVCDWKTSSSYPKAVKEKYFEQMAAYALMLSLEAGLTPVTELHILPLNPRNKYGYGAPIKTTEVRKYINRFMEDLLFINPTLTNPKLYE
jgi:predicted RecB family nuclease